MFKIECDGYGMKVMGNVFVGCSGCVNCEDVVVEWDGVCVRCVVVEVGVSWMVEVCEGELNVWENRVCGECLGEYESGIVMWGGVE